MFWVTLIRAGLLFVLGFVLIFYPDKTRPILINMMGMFWLVAGVVSLRWGIADSHERGLPLFAGIIGMLVGVAVMTRHFTFAVVSDDLVIYTLATLVLLTGILHISRGFRSAEQYSSVWSVQSFLLGVVEIALAVILFATPEREQLDYVPLTVWALMGGLILVSQALLSRQKSRQKGIGEAL